RTAGVRRRRRQRLRRRARSRRNCRQARRALLRSPAGSVSRRRRLRELSCEGNLVESGAREAPRLRIAYFGPVPPRVGAVAEYGERLLAELAERAWVGVFIEGELPSSRSITERCRLYDLARVHYRNVLFEYDVVIHSVPSEP